MREAAHKSYQGVCNYVMLVNTWIALESIGLNMIHKTFEDLFVRKWTLLKGGQNPVKC